MLKKEEIINFWIEQANDDWTAVTVLFNGKKYLQSLFFAHLVIEKICKAIWIKNNTDNIPPRSHNLLFLISNIILDLPDNYSQFMLNLNRFQLEGRYPEYLTKMHNICNKEFSNDIIQQTNELKIWLLKKLQ